MVTGRDTEAALPSAEELFGPERDPAEVTAALREAAGLPRARPRPGYGGLAEVEGGAEAIETARSMRERMGW